MLSLVTIPKKDEQEIDFKFPLPRTGAAMTILDYKMYLWGGHTQFLLEAGDDECCPIDDILPNSEDNSIDVYNIPSRQWETHSTSGNIPDIGDGATMVGYKNSLFLFGGFNEGAYNSDMYELNTLTYVWLLIVVSGVKPSPRYRMDSVLYDKKLYIFGGVGPTIQGLQPGAQCVSAHRYNRDMAFSWNNEMFSFDLEKKLWADVDILNPEERPPPCASFTFNMISPHRAVLFGGNQEAGNVENVYFFDFNNMSWSRSFVQRDPSEPWPAGRSLHTACSIFNPQEETEPHLLVIWGKGRDSKHCNDVWALNTVTMTWAEVPLNVRSKMWHMTSACYFDGKTEVLIFGGNIRRSSKYERHTVTDLTILSFGVLSLKEYCLLAVKEHNLQNVPLYSNLPLRIKNIVENFSAENYRLRA